MWWGKPESTVSEVRSVQWFLHPPPQFSQEAHTFHWTPIQPSRLSSSIFTPQKFPQVLLTAVTITDSFGQVSLLEVLSCCIVTMWLSLFLVCEPSRGQRLTDSTWYSIRLTDILPSIFVAWRIYEFISCDSRPCNQYWSPNQLIKVLEIQMCFVNSNVNSNVNKIMLLKSSRKKLPMS